MISSQLVYVAANGIISFLSWQSHLPLCRYVICSSFIFACVTPKCSGKHSLRRTAWIVECNLLRWRVWGSFLFSQGPQSTFVKTLYTLSVLLKPTSPNSLNLGWKVLKGDTIRLQPWFIIRRVSWLYIVAYINGCRKDYKDDWLHKGLLHSFWRQEILVWSLVFDISLGGQFGCRYVIPMATRHMVQSSLKEQAGVYLFFKMQSAQPVPFLRRTWHSVSSQVLPRLHSVEVCVFFKFRFSLSIHRSGITGSYDSSIFPFKRHLPIAFLNGCYQLHPTNIKIDPLLLSWLQCFLNADFFFFECRFFDSGRLTPLRWSIWRYLIVILIVMISIDLPHWVPFQVLFKNTINLLNFFIFCSESLPY